MSTTHIDLIVASKSGVLTQVLASLLPLGLHWESHKIHDRERNATRDLSIIANGNSSQSELIYDKFTSISGVIDVLNISTDYNANELQFEAIDGKQHELATALLRRRRLNATPVLLEEYSQLNTLQTSPYDMIDIYFSCVLDRLLGLMARIGGEPFERILEEAIVESAIRQNWTLEDHVQEADVKKVSLLVVRCRKILNFSIFFSINLLGKDLVKAELVDLNSQLISVSTNFEIISEGINCITMIENIET